MNKYDILAWFFPNKCLLCGEYVKPNEFICIDCMPNKLLERGYNIKIKDTTKFVKIYSLHYYNGHFEEVLQRYKFKNKTSYSRKFIGALLRLTSCIDFAKYDRICYVPMTEGAVKKRGYNQAELLAKNLSKCTGLKVINAIKKTKDNKIQHKLKIEERAENVKGVYEIQSDIKGQNIILIDDIITTGATVCQCARMLFLAGAKNVTIFCIADTPPKHKDNTNN